jgi:DNA-binding transcriptional regulator YbjK
VSIVHVFTLAADGHYTPGTTQLRYHQCVPWDEAYELYLDPKSLDALLALAVAALKASSSQRLRGRVFDVLRTVREAQPITPATSSVRNKDNGPYAVVTTSATVHRIELEELLATWSDIDWMHAKAFGHKLTTLMRQAGDRI